MEREPRNLTPGLAPWLSPVFSYSQDADNCVCMDLIICACKNISRLGSDNCNREEKKGGCAAIVKPRSLLLIEHF